MGRRQKAILASLSGGDWVPGRALAEEVGVMGYLLWHYVERLRDRGYQIEGDKVRGYRLAA